MTLHTRIGLLKPVPVAELYRWGNVELLKVDPDLVHRMQETTDWSLPGVLTLGNDFGQGFDAIFWIEYRADGPLYPEPVYHDAEGEETTEPTDDLAHPAYAVEVNFDTAYGYRNEQGWGCEDLHASYITQLAQWAEEMDTEIIWNNEFTGEWFEGTDGLEDFGGRGARTAQALDVVVKAFAEAGVEVTP